MGEGGAGPPRCGQPGPHEPLDLACRCLSHADVLKTALYPSTLVILPNSRSPKTESGGHHGGGVRLSWK